MAATKKLWFFFHLSFCLTSSRFTFPYSFRPAPHGQRTLVWRVGSFGWNKWFTGSLTTNLHPSTYFLHLYDFYLDHTRLRQTSQNVAINPKNSTSIFVWLRGWLEAKHNYGLRPLNGFVLMCSAAFSPTTTRRANSIISNNTWTLQDKRWP